MEQTYADTKAGEGVGDVEERAEGIYERIRAETGLQRQRSIEIGLDDRKNKISEALLLRRDLVRFVESLLDFSQLVFHVHEKHSPRL